MPTRAEELAEKRRDLQTRCALQRQEAAFFSNDIEARLVSADRVINVVSSIARNPVALIATIAGAMILGPWRIMRWASQGALLFKVVRKVQQLIAK
jgi:hypothetical protein